MLVFMLYLLALPMWLNGGDTRLLQSQEEGCLTHIRPSHLLICKPAKVYRQATEVNGNTIVTFCWSERDLYETAESNACTTKHKAKATQLKNNNVNVLEWQSQEFVAVWPRA